MSNASSLVNGSARPGNSTLADLTSAVRRTEGDRPPPLVGCSITLVGDSIYVFGGRLVPTRTMVSTLYCLSLRTLIWTLLSPTHSPASPPNSLEPAPRYFHSADVWGKKLVIYGGEGYSPLPLEGATELSPLCTQGDICIWDTETNSWELPEPTCAPGVDPPASRYAHLGVISSYLPSSSTTDPRTPFSTTTEGKEAKERSMLIIIGGQNLQNTYLHSVNVLDLDEMKWVKEGNWEKNIGTYRAVAASPKYRIVPSGDGSSNTAPTTNENGTTSNGLPRSASTAFPPPPPLPPSSPSRTRPGSRPTTPSPLATSSIAGELQEANLGLAPFETLSHLSYSELPTQEKAEPILVFSNFNFTDVRRDLDLMASPTPPARSVDTTPLSKLMTGLALPPGLRFPTGTIIGRHLLVFGTFLSQNINNFSIWALDLGRAGAGGTVDGLREGESGVLGWMRVDPGMVLSKGSWNRAVGWGNSIVVLGDRERDIALDYDHRQTNFAHVAFVDTEAFGIYQPPPQPLSLAAQSLGLATLSHPHLSDFEIICSDGVRLACSRSLLIERWSWFAELVVGFEERSKEIPKGDVDETVEKSGLLDVVVEENDATEPNTPVPLKTFPVVSSPPNPPTTKLTPRTLLIPSPSPLVQAFLQYLYTHALSTPLQLSLPILSSLLLFSKTYRVDNLRALVVHALHEALTSGGWTAAAVYEAATLGGATALQIRALKMMMGGTRTGTRVAGGIS